MDMDAARINRATLRFPRNLEREYQDYYSTRNAVHARAALLSGILLYGVLAHLDYVIAPASWRTLWLVRLAIVMPVLLALFTVALTASFGRLMQPLLTIACMIVATSVDVMNVLAFEYTGQAYYVGIIITNMYLYTVGRVQWAWAAPAGIANVAIYALSLLFVSDAGVPLMVTSAYFMGSTLVLGMVACYTIDHMARIEFVHARDLSRVNGELRQYSSTDPLTGLLNRRSGMQRLNEAAARSLRTRRAFCIAIVDADHFKKINDKWGHACGDTVLKSLAALTADRIRGSDVVARWGGEEFLLLFPDTRLAGARIAAEQLRRRVHDLDIRQEGSTVAVSITIGIIEVQPGENPNDALRRADDALYEGKRAGRDRTVTGEPVPIANGAVSEHQPGRKTEQQSHAGDIGRRGDEDA